MGDGGVGLDADALRLAELQQLAGRVPGVDQQLVHVRGHLGVLEQVLEVGAQEVRHPDGADGPGPVRLLEGAPHLAVLLGVVAGAELGPRLRGVDEHQVDVVQPHRLQRLLDRGDRALVVLDLGGDLRRDEQLLAGDPGSAHSLADAALVAVGLGGVDVAVADLDRRTDGVRGLVVVDEPGAEPEAGDPGAAGEGIGLGQDAHAFSPSVVVVVGSCA